MVREKEWRKIEINTEDLTNANYFTETEMKRWEIIYKISTKHSTFLHSAKRVKKIARTFLFNKSEDDGGYISFDSLVKRRVKFF